MERSQNCNHANAGVLHIYIQLSTAILPAEAGHCFSANDAGPVVTYIQANCALVVMYYYNGRMKHEISTVMNGHTVVRSGRNFH